MERLNNSTKQTITSHLTSLYLFPLIPIYTQKSIFYRSFVLKYIKTVLSNEAASTADERRNISYEYDLIMMNQLREEYLSLLTF